MRHCTCPQQRKSTAMARPQLLFPRSASHQATLDDCLIRPEWLWALKSWLPRAQTEARFPLSSPLPPTPPSSPVKSQETTRTVLPSSRGGVHAVPKRWLWHARSGSCCSTAGSMVAASTPSWVGAAARVRCSPALQPATATARAMPGG